MQAIRPGDGDDSLTQTDVRELTAVLSDLHAAWRRFPLQAKRGFGSLLFPSGYVFQRVRTAEKGLLFKTFGASHNDVSDVVSVIKENPNTLMAEIRKLLALIHFSKEPEKKAT